MAASYPGSKVSFTTKTGVDEMQSSQINAVQDEIMAVEDGLLNGLAHALIAATTALYSLGSSTKKWVNLWLSGAANVGTSVNADYDTTGTDSNGLRLYRGDGSTARVYAWRFNNYVVSGTRSLLRWLYHNGTSESVIASFDSNGMMTAGALTLTGIETIATLAAGSNNNLAIAASTQMARLAGDSGGTSTITGISASAVIGRVLNLTNCSTYNIALSHVSGSSSAGNQFLLPNAATVTLNQYDSITLWYDTTGGTGYWRVLSAY